MANTFPWKDNYFALENIKKSAMYFLWIIYEADEEVSNNL